MSRLQKLRAAEKQASDPFCFVADVSSFLALEWCDKEACVLP
jgi:hypothetical protein